MLRHASLMMIFSDLLAEPGPILESLYRLRHGGHDVILFHILDEAEVGFPFARHGRTGGPREPPAADAWTPTASAAITRPRSRPFAARYRRECSQAGIDYVPLDTSMQFDRALTEYLVNRSQQRIETKDEG